jgi:ketosteroid isomerase-like protein
MKLTRYAVRTFFFTLLIGCTNNNNDDKDKAIAEIQKAEKEFAQMTAEKGIAESFWFYADSNAVIKRQNDTLIHGKEQIRRYYSDPFYSTAKVEWSPDFTDASADGGLGYTYGKYLWRVQDSNGKVLEYKGVFHTVWKKQKDGSWKYVWD